MPQETAIELLNLGHMWGMGVILIAIAVAGVWLLGNNARSKPESDE